MAQPVSRNSSAPAPSANVWSGWRPNALGARAFEGGERGGPARVAHELGGSGDRGGGVLDLPVRDAEDDRVATWDLAASGGAVHVHSSGAQPGAERRSEPAVADHAHP